MIVFHGTLEEHIKSIKKNGILEYTADQWLLEVIETKICCISNQPVSGEGGNATFFAYSFVRTKNQNGYLTVLDIPHETLRQKTVAIFDNKTLDDYVRFHFFVREEFRYIGRILFAKMTEYRLRDRYFYKFSNIVLKRPATEKEVTRYQSDQRLYYKKVREERFFYDIEECTISDELWDMLQYIGNWPRVYEFLQLHFGQIEEKNYDEFAQKEYVSHGQYWKDFYKKFPIIIQSSRKEHFQDWFSPQWLAKRKITEPIENCQILCKKLEPEYILGFIHITTPSGFPERLRNLRSKSAFTTEIWKEVHRLIKEK